MSESDDRRRFGRLPMNDDVQVWTDEHSWEGQLVNQSLGGVGILLDDDGRVQVGMQVRVKGEFMEATGFIRYRREKDGSLLIGVAWDEREKARKQKNEFATFYVNGPLDVVCKRNVHYQDDGDASFQLWDGTQFTEHKNRLKSVSLDERRNALHSDVTVLTQLLQLYDLGRCTSTTLAVDRIVDFEFSL